MNLVDASSLTINNNQCDNQIVPEIYPETFWLARREEVCLEPGTIYLNTGSFAPLPRCVDEALRRLRSRLAASPSDFFWRQTPPALCHARARVAGYINAPMADVLLVPNATFALNLAMHSLTLQPGDEILVTDQEYGAMVYLCQDVARRAGASVTTVKLPFPVEDPNELVQAVEKAITPRTRVLHFSHVTSPTGMVLPAAELCQVARHHGVLSVVDGAHAPGMVPVDCAEIHADFYAGNCHKWLMAPPGAAFLVVTPELKPHILPRLVSWGWEYDPDRAEEDSGWGGSYWTRNLEFHGTTDRCAQLVLPEVFDFRARLGERVIHGRIRQLVDYVRQHLGAIGYCPMTPVHPRLHGSLTAFAVPPLDVVKARDWIWRQFRVESPFTTVGGRCFLRVSTAWFNTISELDQLVHAMKNLPVDRLQ